MAATNYISFDLDLNECQLQQADEQNSFVQQSSTMITHHKVVPYHYNCVEPNSMLTWRRGQERLDGMRVSEEFS